MTAASSEAKMKDRDAAQIPHALAYENLAGRFGANVPCHITKGTHVNTRGHTNVMSSTVMFQSMM